MTNRVLDLEVYGGPDDVFEIARVELDQEAVERIKALSAEVRRLGIYKMQLFDYRVMPFNEGLEQYDEPVPVEQRLDCVCMNVTSDSFFWSGYVKHDDRRWETESTSVVSLEEREPVAAPDHPACPKCGCTRFEMDVSQRIKVEFDPEEVPDGEPHDVYDGPEGDMEWTDDTYAICVDCGHVGTLRSMAGLPQTA